jgi:hypothetical protein
MSKLVPRVKHSCPFHEKIMEISKMLTGCLRIRTPTHASVLAMAKAVRSLVELWQKNVC